MDIVEQMQLSKLPPVARQLIDRMGEMLDERYAQPLPASEHAPCPPTSPISAGSPDLPTPSPKLLTPRDAAKALAVCEKTLFNMTKAGEIPAVKIGRAVRYSVADLARWVEQQKFIEH